MWTRRDACAVLDYSAAGNDREERLHDSQQINAEPVLRWGAIKISVSSSQFQWQGGEASDSCLTRDIKIFPFVFLLSGNDFPFSCTDDSSLPSLHFLLPFNTPVHSVYLCSSVLHSAFLSICFLRHWDCLQVLFNCKSLLKTTVLNEPLAGVSVLMCFALRAPSCTARQKSHGAGTTMPFWGFAKHERL